MDSPKQLPAPLRYFFARFKPLSQPKWWVPSSIIILGGTCIWLYWNHPEWLGGGLVQSQPQSETPNLEAPGGNLLNDPLEKLAIDFPDSNSVTPTPNNLPSLSPTLPSNPLNKPPSDGSAEKPPANNPLDQLTQSPTTAGKSPQFSRIFSPLIPSFKDAPVPTASDILKQITSPPPAGQVSISPLPATPVTGNPRQEAAQQPSRNSGTSGIPPETPRSQQQGVNPPQPVVPTYPGYGYGVPAQPPGATYPPPYYTYGGQPAPVSPPPYYNAQPPAGRPQQPYGSPYYGYGGQPVAPNQPYQTNPNQQPQERSPFSAPIFRSY